MGEQYAILFTSITLLKNIINIMLNFCLRSSNNFSFYLKQNQIVIFINEGLRNMISIFKLSVMICYYSLLAQLDTLLCRSSNMPANSYFRDNVFDVFPTWDIFSLDTV